MVGEFPIRASGSVPSVSVAGRLILLEGPHLQLSPSLLWPSKITGHWLKGKLCIRFLRISELSTSICILEPSGLFLVY